MSGYQHREIRLGRHRLDTKPKILPEREKKSRQFRIRLFNSEAISEIQVFCFPFQIEQGKGIR